MLLNKVLCGYPTTSQIILFRTILNSEESRPIYHNNFPAKILTLVLLAQDDTKQDESI